MAAKNWIASPKAAQQFDLAGGKLKAQWARLHLGDREPYPARDALAERFPGEEISAEVVAGVLDAWRAFHCGEFQRAHELSAELGPAAAAPGLKAVGVYASHAETNAKRAESLLLDASERAAELAERFAKEANAHYLLAFTLGRYSQRISVVEALAKGFAGRIERALQQTLKLEPKHADAHIALGLYHAEIVNKLGSLAAGLTYGASGAKAQEHFKKALKLNAVAPVAALEYAHGLRLLDARRNLAEVNKLLARAAACEPADAMEWLDRERARKLLDSADR